MENEISPPLSRIEQLSVELRQMILSALSDVVSLKSAALTCPALYNALTSAETIITTRVLINQVDLDVLPEAVASQESLCLESYTEKSIQDFIAKHFHKRKHPPKLWTLANALPIGKSHECVRQFTLKFVATAVEKSPMFGSKPVAPTHAEKCRIERAFYRFEIFCNLFRGFGTSDMEFLLWLWDNSSLNFSPWEHEQLACIHDFLVQAVYPAFNDIAEHDIAWGEFDVEYGDRRDSPFIQNVLSFGLETLWQISIAKTYEARYELLYTGHCPRLRSPFLYQALNHANRVDDSLFLSDFNPTDEQTHIRPPFFDDPDTGPADIWRWAHQEETWANFVNQENRKSLREGGYVMWDRCRLDELGILQTPWKAPVSSQEELQRDIQRHAEMKASWKARSGIYMAGGRGWWSLGDHSKIVWKGGKAPWEGRSGYARINPNSLDEARDALGMMKLASSVTEALSRRPT